MGVIRQQTTEPNSLEDKQNGLSHKVWDLEKTKPVVNINSNGTIDGSLFKKVKNNLENNRVSASDYGANANERRLLIKIGEDIFYLNSFKINESSDTDDIIADLTALTTTVSGKQDLVEKDASNGYVGLDAFKVKFRNLANTFTSFLTNTATAARTYLFQDRDGTIMDNTNLVTGATDNSIIRSDGTGGKTTQGSGAISTLDDSGNLITEGGITCNTFATYLKLFFGALSSSPTLFSGVWLAQASPSASNYLLLGSTSQSFINAPSSNIQLRVGNTTFMSIGGTGVEITSTGNVTPSTSRFKIQAGSSTISQINLLHTATKKATPLAGDITFVTDDLFITITTGNAEKAFILDNGARLTSGRVPFATTNGRLTDDADLTFAIDTLTATKIVGSTSIKAGSAGGYLSSDGSAGATGTFTTVDLKTVTVKDGIITSIV